jgi:hypothetical protein
VNDKRDLAVFGREMARRCWDAEVQLGHYTKAEIRDSSMLAALVRDAEATRDHLAAIRGWQSSLLQELAAIRRLLEKPKRKTKRARKENPNTEWLQIAEPKPKRARGKK